MIKAFSTPLKLGMVGGGIDSMIGETHRIASRLDNAFELVAGALSSSPERAAESAQTIGISPERSYASYEEMAKTEAAREDGIDAVSIVTPNHMHYPVAKAFIDAGIHVICDKPMTASLADAEALVKLAEQTDKVFVLTHNYSAYPMVRQAKQMVRDGALGKLRVVQAEYAQDWLSKPLETTDHKQASWRADPKRSGDGGAIADIGTHVYQLMRFITDEKPNKLAADLAQIVDGRVLDDNASIMLRFAHGARGMIWVSQVATGNENGLRLRLYGDEGGLEWSQEHPNHLWYTKLGEAKQLLTKAGAGSNAAGQATSRVPGGHPEGYLAGFGALYHDAAQLIHDYRAGRLDRASSLLPTVHDGLEGLQFIDCCVKSSQADAAWVDLP